jgi:hypothetical protein
MALAFQNIWTTWQAVAAIAAVISIGFAAMGYLLAHIFRYRELEIWVKEELYQAIASAFIVGVAVIAVTLIVNLSCTLVGGCGGGDHLSVAINILDNMKTDVSLQLQYLFELSMRVGFIKSMGKYYDFTLGPQAEACMVGECDTAFGWSWFMWAGSSVIADSIDYSFSVMIPIISSIFAQLWMLRFIQATLFPSLLALGIILRTFFFTRKVGGLLIAIAIGLYTVYPLMYVMLGSYMTFTPRQFYYPTNDWSHSYAFISCLGGAYLPGGGSANAPFCTGFPGVVSFIFPGLPTAVGNFGNADFMFRNGCDTGDPNSCPGSTCVGATNFCCPDAAGCPPNSLPPDVYAGMRSPYDGVLPIVGYLMVPAFFIPLIIILVTVAFIRNLSPMLGGDVEIAGLTRFI